MKHVTKYAVLVTVAVALAGCSPSGDPDAVPLLPVAESDEIQSMVAEAGRPVVVNVWASWCIPCRSEAPLLREAHAQFGEDVLFIGLDVSDNQDNARAFLDEFGLTGFDHYFDPNGIVAAELGGAGVPRTLFYDSDGDLVELHFGVIDERGLAFNLDESLRR